MTLTDLPAASDAERALPVGDALVRRVRGEYHLDEWGLDDDLVRTLLPLARLRWSIDLVGAPHLPLQGPALLVFNQRAGISERSVLATAVNRATARVVRHPGVPDLAPVGPLLRRLGGVLRRPDEVAGLLRAGRLVGVPLRREVLSRHAAGAAPAELLAPALELGVPVVPVALAGSEVGWRWTVAVGAAIDADRRPGPLAATELAERARHAVQELLDEHVSAPWPFR